MPDNSVPNRSVQFDLSDRTILMTGASSGLGEHFARRLAAMGARVALAARRTDKLAQIASELRAEGAVVEAVALDVADAESIERGFEAARAALGPINGVIANAGINQAGPATRLKAEELDAVLSVNVRGAFLTAREAARHMPADGSGRVLLVASIGGIVPLPGLAAYSTSKAAVVMMGKALAREWATRGINVNILCPGFVRTPLNSEWFDTPKGREQIAGFPRKRLMEASDLDIPVFMAMSSASSGLTGSVLVVDDGQTLA